MTRLLYVTPLTFLMGCTMLTPPPAISYDPKAFTEAKLEAEPPRPVEIVAQPEPLPLPGQLKPLPSDDGWMEVSGARRDLRPPRERIEMANAAARLEPVEDGYINAIQVYPFVEGALYRLYAAPDQVTDVALQPGEQLVAVSAGDTVRWIIGDTTSGLGPDQQVHILIKASAPDLTTNLVITTDRRTYHLELLSTEATYMAALSWTYPGDELLALQRQNDEAIAHEAASIDQGLSLEQLQFRYSISGDQPPWRPIRAFDDGSKVYIQFPDRLDQGEAPPLFVVGHDGATELVNYRVRDTYYIVDRLFAAAELRLGQEPQQVVRITRDGDRPSVISLSGLF